MADAEKKSVDFSRIKNKQRRSQVYHKEKERKSKEKRERRKKRKREESAVDGEVHEFPMYCCKRLLIFDSSDHCVLR